MELAGRRAGVRDRRCTLPPCHFAVIPAHTCLAACWTIRQRCGSPVAVLARGHDGLVATVADIDQLGRPRGGRGIGIAADVSDPAQVEAAAAQVERELGPIDVVTARYISQPVAVQVF